MLYSLCLPGWSISCLDLFCLSKFSEYSKPWSNVTFSRQFPVRISLFLTLNAHHLLVQTHFTHLSSHKMAPSSRAKNISGSSLYHVPTTIDSALHLAYACKTQVSPVHSFYHMGEYCHRQAGCLFAEPMFGQARRTLEKPQRIRRINVNSA